MGLANPSCMQDAAFYAESAFTECWVVYEAAPRVQDGASAVCATLNADLFTALRAVRNEGLCAVCATAGVAFLLVFVFKHLGR